MRTLLTFILTLSLFYSCTEKGNNKQEEESKMKLEIKAEALVGEGAIWNHESKCLLWIDIDGKRLFEYNPQTKKQREFILPHPAGTVVPIDGNNVILALADGIYSFNLEKELLQKKADNPSTWRFNDGKCDPSGRLWVGNLDTEQYSRPICTLYKVDTDFSITEEHSGVIISNGIIWSIDGKRVYYIDTPTKKLTCFDFDNENGKLLNPTDCLTFPDSLGQPDGNTIDSEGKLWVAFWNGGYVVRCDPEKGEILDTYKVPAHNVTSVAFGGDQLETLFITTATNDMSEEEKQQYPDAGSVFSFKPGVKGINARFFIEK